MTTKAEKFAFGEITSILVQPYSDHLGPYDFDMSPWLPDGVTITAVTVESWKGRTSTTSLLIDGTPTVVGNKIYVYFKYPGDSYRGKHKLTFKCTGTGGFKDEADLGYVEVMTV